MANLAPGAITQTTTLYASPYTFVYCTADIAPTVPVLSSPAFNASLNSTTYAMSNGIPEMIVTLSWQTVNFGWTCQAGTDTYIVGWSQDPTVISYPSYFHHISDDYYYNLNIYFF